MGDHELTPEGLKLRYSTNIDKASTFKTNGVSEQAITSYLISPDGSKYLDRLVQADPSASAAEIRKRAVEQLQSGRDLPRMELSKAPLFKIVPTGKNVPPYSPFFAKQSAFEDALASGHNLSDYFGLPIKSEGARYDIYQIQPKASTEAFVHRVAPTSELGGLITKAGGGEQVLVPNRQLFNDPVYVKTVDNTRIVTAEVERGTSTTAVRSLGTLGVATAVLYDATTTTSRVSDLREQGNLVGAQSDVMHFGGRNLGALGGALLGAQVLGAAGAETGPLDVVIGGVGAVGGAFGGEKLADAYDRHRIYNQPDPQGVTWKYEPAKPQQGWTHDIPPLPDTPLGQHFTADPALADRLFYQANNTAVELALAHTTEPRDPYTQPAAAHDTPSRIAAPWTRDVQTQAWSRHVTDQVLEHGLTSTHIEAAIPQRATQLDTAAQQTIAGNLAGSQRGIAEHYQAAYEQRGWEQHGPMPEAVTSALKTPTNTLQASDGHTYTRGSDGQWKTPGVLYGTNAAEGNLLNELDATRHQQRALHGESSQTDPAQEAQRQQETQGHGAAREAPLPLAPAAIAPGMRVPEREPSPVSNRASPSQDTQPSAPARVEPATVATATSHAALAAQQAQQPAMHAQQQSQQAGSQEERPASLSRASTSLEPDRVAEAAALAPSAVLSQRATAPTLSPPLDPPSMRDFRHAEHPLNARYQMFRDALGEQGFHQDRPTLNAVPEVRGYSAEQKDRLAAGFTAQLGADQRFNTEI
ncbi:MAG: hypothetical protein ABI129_08945, partial [Rhodanobacter sp.]